MLILYYQIFQKQFHDLPCNTVLSKPGVQSGRGHRDDEAKIGSDFSQCFGHKIGPRARNDTKLGSLERKFRGGSF